MKIKKTAKRIMGFFMAVALVLTTINLPGFSNVAFAAIQTDYWGNEYITNGIGNGATMYYLDSSTPQNITDYITGIDPGVVDASDEFRLGIVFENIPRSALVVSQSMGMWTSNYIHKKWYFDLSSLHMVAKTTSGSVYDANNTVIGSFDISDNVVTITWDNEDFLWKITEGGVEYGCFKLSGTYASTEGNRTCNTCDPITINNKVMTTLYPNGFRGAWGENASFVYDQDNATLTISGTKLEGALHCDLFKTATSVVINDGVEEIGEGAFTGFESLTEIEIDIPSSVTSVGASAFADCNSLNVYYSGTENEWDEIQIADGNSAITTPNKLYCALFASSASAASTNATLDTSNRKTIRYDGSSMIGSIATWNANDITITSAESNEFLYVQWKDGDTDYVYSCAVAEGILPARTIGGDNFRLNSDCKIWIEKKESNRVYAKMVEIGHEHSWGYGVKTTNTNNDTLVAYCNETEYQCAYKSIETGLTLTITAPQTTEGKAASVQIGTEAEQTAWLNAGLTLPTSFVVKKDGEIVENSNLAEGSYTVEVSIGSGEETVTATTALDVHKHTWEYGINTSDDTLVAYCNHAECQFAYTSLETGLTLTITAIQTADGKAVSAQIGTEAEQTAWLNAGLTLPTSFVVKMDGETVENANLAEGSYTVEVSIGSGEETVTATTAVDVYKHSWVYGTKTSNTSNDTLVAYCNDTECQCAYKSFETGFTLTIKAPVQIPLGKAVSVQFGTEAEQTAWLNAGLTLPTSFVVKKNGETVENANLTEGNYTVEVTIGSGENVATATDSFVITLGDEIDTSFLTREAFFNPNFNNIYNLNGGIKQAVFIDGQTLYIAGMNDDGTLRLVDASEETVMNMDLTDVLFASVVTGYSRDTTTPISNELYFRYKESGQLDDLEATWTPSGVNIDYGKYLNGNCYLYVQWKEGNVDKKYCYPFNNNYKIQTITATEIGGEGFKLNSDCRIWIGYWANGTNVEIAMMVEHECYDENSDYLCDACGEHIIEKGFDWYNNCYSLDKYTGKLTISGSGDFTGGGSSKELIKSIEIEDGISGLTGYGVFENCTNLKSISIPESFTTVKFHVFPDCNNLKTVFYAGTSEQWSQISISPENDALTNATIITSDSVEKVSLALDGTLKVQIKFLSSNVTNWTINGEAFTVDSNNCATIDVAPKDYEQDIVIGYGQGDEAVTIKSFTVADLLDRYEEDANTKAIAESLEAYCSAAEAYFGEQPVADYSTDWETVSNATGGHTVTMKEKYYGSSLVLESGTILRHYYTEDFVGSTGSKYGYYYVDQMIPAHLYAKESVSEGTYCVNDYIYRALNNPSSTANLKNLCVALYNYGKAAEQYRSASE